MVHTLLSRSVFEGVGLREGGRQESKNKVRDLVDLLRYALNEGSLA